MTLLFFNRFLRTVLLFVLSFFLFLIGKYDIRFRKIPNKYIICTGVTGGFIRFVYYYDVINIKSVVCGLVTMCIFLIIIVIFIPGSFGGGDIKLFICSSLFLGMKVWDVFVITILGAFPVAFFKVLTRNDDKYFPIGPYISIGILLEILLLLYGLT